MSAHTPGPWTAGTTTVGALNNAGTSRFACQLHGGLERDDPKGYDRAKRERTSDEELQANANLIAAAPDLLAAFEAIAPMFDNDSPLLTVYRAEIAAVQAAIAKAKGQVG